MSSLSTLYTDYKFTDYDFQKVRRYIYERAGISIAENKRDMVFSRLLRRLSALNLKSFYDYLSFLERNSSSPEWQEFVNALTTNLTSFFREPYHFEYLAELVKKQSNQSFKRFTIWSSASSTGEEPYSIAMSLIEAFDYNFKIPVTILATDIDTQVLKTAQEGIYSQDKVAGLSHQRLSKFFMKGSGEKTGLYKIRNEVKQLIHFRQVNLLDPIWSIRGPLDAIFCRNVLIYFDRQTQHQILKRFAPLLDVNGILCIGHSESLFDMTDIYRLTGKTTYQAIQSENTTSASPSRFTPHRQHDNFNFKHR